MEERKLPRREREKLAQRKEMLAAALELFSKKGYRNVSMHEIAEKAEFAIGTLYKFFNNKEDLYQALILEQFYRFRAALTKAIEEPDDEIQKLQNYVQAKGEVFRANVSMIRLYFAETHGAQYNVMAGFDSEMRERRCDFMQTLASIFESGMKRKRFRRIADPYHLAVALDSITNAFLFLWLDEPERHPYPEDPDTVLNILFKGLIDR
jgi:TetR/AcrR family transcriptional regulator